MAFWYIWPVILGSGGLIVERYWMHDDELFWMSFLFVTIATLGIWDSWRTGES